MIVALGPHEIGFMDVFGSVLTVGDKFDLALGVWMNM